MTAGTVGGEPCDGDLMLGLLRDVKKSLNARPGSQFKAGKAGKHLAGNAGKHQAAEETEDDSCRFGAASGRPVWVEADARETVLGLATVG